MSRIEKLPQKVLDDITPYLLTGEVIDKALLQDNKKPKVIWIIKTNQAIILHGTQPDKPQPAIMVMALDEIREIDYLEKPDDIQIIFYSSRNNGKAVFHFEKSAFKEIEKLIGDLGDLVTVRYQTEKGKIQVSQKALPIGDKDRKVFGRGKVPEAAFLAKNKQSKPVVEKTPLVPEKKDIPLRTIESKVATPKPTVQQKLPEEKAAKATNTVPEKEKVTEKTVVEPKVQQTSVKPTENITPSKTEATKAVNTVHQSEQKVSEPKVDEAKQNNVATKTSAKATQPRNSLISHLQENPIPPKEETKEEDKKSKEIDFGSPVYYIGVTIIATIVGFFCLSFFKLISRVVKYFRKH